MSQPRNSYTVEYFDKVVGRWFSVGDYWGFWTALATLDSWQKKYTYDRFRIRGI